MEEIIQSADGQVTEEIPKEPMKGKNGSKKIIWILLFIFFFLLAGVVYFYIKSNENVTPQNVEEKETIEEEPKVEDNSNVTSSKVEEKETVEEEPKDNKDNDEKKDTTEDNEFRYNFPEGYTVSKESCNTENALSSLSVSDCVEVYKIQPANYTALEKKYLLSASVIVFSKPNNVVIPGQMTQTRYDSQLKKWVFEDGNGELKVLPERIENSNIIVETSQEGSQRGWDDIIISKPNTSSLLILSIPKYHRIVCDYFGQPTAEKTECERFLASLGLNPEDEGWLPGSIYQTAYSSLRSNASTIW